MNINRHNYEEFFILYMDNELSSDDRRMVETFVQLHPDLKEELDILLQYKLEPDTSIVFAGKEELMMLGGSTMINSNNYEEWLTLYVDNELTSEQKINVEQFIAVNPLAAQELVLLQKTKLQPEEIVFAHKESLYREEEKVRRIPAFWWRAVAAILIVALGLTTFLLVNKKPAADKDNTVASTNGSQEKTTAEVPVIVKTKDKPEVKVENKQIPLQAVPNDVRNAVADNNNQQINNTTVTKKDNNSANTKLKEIIPAPVTNNNDEALADNSIKTNNLPKPESNRKTIVAAVNDNDVANTTVSKNNTISNLLTNTNVTNQSPKTSDFVQVAHPIADPSNDELDQSTGKKSKLRGFFRKVTRTFEKRTNINPTDDDEKLLVGGLAIRLK